MRNDNILEELRSLQQYIDTNSNNKSKLMSKGLDKKILLNQDSLTKTDVKRSLNKYSKGIELPTQLKNKPNGNI